MPVTDPCVFKETPKIPPNIIKTSVNSLGHLSDAQNFDSERSQREIQQDTAQGPDLPTSLSVTSSPTGLLAS